MWDNSSFVMMCLSSPEPQPISIASSLVKAVIVCPPSFYVLFLALRQRRQPQSLASTTSHSDYFTFHMISLQLLIILGMSLYFGGYVSSDVMLVAAGFYCTTMSYSLELLVHCITCVDRYLAVVHPVTYLKLKKANGNRVRKAAMACAWLLCLGYVSTLFFNPDHVANIFISLLGLNLSVICFCTLSVLCVLDRPGPSSVEKVDQSKRKALNTIIAIMITLLFWLMGIFVCMALQHAAFLSRIERCYLFATSLMFNIPSQLVLPLLYLKRRGKLPCCRK